MSVIYYYPITYKTFSSLDIPSWLLFATFYLFEQLYIKTVIFKEALHFTKMI